MNARVEALRSRLEEPLIVTNQVNILYLTGFESDNAALLVEAERIRLFTDFRYVEAAREVGGVEVEQTARNLLADLTGRLTGRVAFEAEDVTYAGWETLGSQGPEPIPRRGLVEQLRMAKDDDELGAIRHAAAITSETFERLAEQRFAGRTERELAEWIEDTFSELGGTGLSYPSIVASGPNAALPHSLVSDRTIGEGETVIVDASPTVDGYCCDCTRTFATGTLPDELRRAYDVCHQAQLAGLAALRPGIAGRGADAAARPIIEEAGFGEAFGHGLGHGVGLVVHERPYLNPESEDDLPASSVVTVEPGIYLVGSGGIRIEDLVIVGEDGPEILTTSTKDLVTVA
jgi:Xaa-Pro aminopeptidase